MKFNTLDNRNQCPYPTYVLHALQMKIQMKVFFRNVEKVCIYIDKRMYRCLILCKQFIQFRKHPMGIASKVVKKKTCIYNQLNFKR